MKREIFDWAKTCPEDVESEQDRIEAAWDRFQMALHARRMGELTDLQIRQELMLDE